MNSQNKTFKCKKPPTDRVISGVEKGKLNNENFSNYVNFLRENNQKLPVNQFGDINLSVVAKTCGFYRQVFTNNESMELALGRAVKEVGSDLVEGKIPSGVLEKDPIQIKKLISNLRHDLAKSEEKIAYLKKQLMNANSETKLSSKKIMEYEDSFEHMIATGRRFTL